MKPSLPIAYTFDEALEQAREVVAQAFEECDYLRDAEEIRLGHHDRERSIIRAMHLAGFRTYPNV